MKIKFTLLLFLLLVTFSAIANYNFPKEKLKKVKLQLNNKTYPHIKKVELQAICAIEELEPDK